MGRRTNDIIHGVLLKVLARALEVEDDECQHRSVTILRLIFARNLRSWLERGPQVCGDYVRLEELNVSADDANGHVVPLAQLSRGVVSDSSCTDRFKQEIMWMLEYSRFQGKGVSPPPPDYLTDRHAVIVTNWCSFPYEDIMFDCCHFEELLMANTWVGSSGAFVRINHRRSDCDGGSRNTVAVMGTIYPSVIEVAQWLSADCDGVRSRTLGRWCMDSLLLSSVLCIKPVASSVL